MVFSMAMQGKAHDGIPAGMIEKVWHSSLQGTDARGFDPKTQLEGGWNATFSIFVSARRVQLQGKDKDGVSLTSGGADGGREARGAAAAFAQVLHRE